MYQVHNLSNSTIIIADLRVEIGPHRIMDLEQVASRSDIDKSFDLRQALKSCLRLTKHSVIKTQKKEPAKVIEKITEKQVFDEEKISQLIKRAISENQAQVDIKTIEQAVANAMTNTIGSLVGKSIPQSTVIEAKIIDDETLANMHQKSLEKITETIETGGSINHKRFNIKNDKSITDFANELD